ncbi:hypothetical protein AVEN_145051-1 [Araneus ventricosus]|uniref:Uncharacterized protein n=1 Tax=Araneus ventricosus TaxID=182803 RepID=A0A4Y2SGU0_ARAVE|nr:hypothetical protein AVEN_145051-1 [Araneus ventricosus]
MPSRKTPLIDLRAPAQIKLPEGLQFISALPLATSENFRRARKGISRNTSMANVPYRVSLSLSSTSEIAPTQLAVMDNDASLDGRLFRCNSSTFDVSPNTGSQKEQGRLKASLLMLGSGCTMNVNGRCSCCV